MTDYNLIERLQNVRWDIYQDPAFKAQIASGILVVISTVALFIILASNPPIASAINTFQAMVTLGTVGSASLAIFAVSSCIQTLAAKKLKQDLANARALTELPPLQVEAPVEVAVNLEQQPIEYIKQVVVLPIVRAFHAGIKGLVIANSVTMSEEFTSKVKSIDTAFEDAEQLFNDFVNNPQIYIAELLRFFGPEKKPLTIALRRWIAAYNSGKPEMIQMVSDEYHAAASAHDYKAISQALKTQSNEALMANLPILLENHFALANVKLKELAINIMHQIFQDTRTNTKVLQALTQLKKKADSSALPIAMEHFLKLVQEEAHISNEQYMMWQEDLTRRMLQTTFKRTVCNALSVLARNIRLLGFMFDQKKTQTELFGRLDETFLLSESDDCITKFALQKDLYHILNLFNSSRTNEEHKYTLVALPEGDTRSYEELIEQEEIFKICFASKKADFAVLEKINQSTEIVALNRKHQVRIVAVPVTINDHPFKKFKRHETAIRIFAPLLKKVLPPIIKPKMKQLLPKMSGNNKARYDRFVETLIDTMLSPVFNGAIAFTDFRPIFEKVISTKGEVLAEKIEALLRSPPEELNFEKIRDAWTEAVRGVADEFVSEAQKYSNRQGE